jgi:hypothetical protein
MDCSLEGGGPEGRKAQTRDSALSFVPKFVNGRKTSLAGVNNTGWKPYATLRS